ncbi:ferrichrome ABC transporter permease [Paenibacillus sp. J45TS6]|uniref:FecCD family ABC transporter permease n=1 Tax=Paenibacillus sp. J45TS6 TaxID=2807196 RepID=UPI001B023CF5|nr:iron ABC transporter permease [Paenibacillus sp. J45TS6]GIP42416.1 ferrichrome ABC transporter permease [Paenibacillus sp. J45TS6]
MNNSFSKDHNSSKLKLRARPVRAFLTLAIGLIAVILFMGVSIAVGAADISLSTVYEALVSFNPDVTQHTIIHELRIPRSIADVLIGAAFAVAGAVMQGMTRNPLADSGLLGINSGAIFMIAVALAFFPEMSYNGTMIFAFIGAFIATALVYGTSSLGKARVTPIRLVLAGAAVSALLTALSQGIAIHFRLSQDLAYWVAGGVAGIKMPQVLSILPWISLALIAAMLVSRSITLISLGDEVASGLGQKTGLIKIIGGMIVLILAGAAVSVAGPIGFVGLVVPHLVRYIVGVDYRYIIPCSAVVGSLLMLLADIGARMINPPYETPISALFALVGVPFFLYISRKSGRGL